MLFDRARIYSKKHIERDAERVKGEAEYLKKEILKCADGKILPEKAELLAYKCTALLDFDNYAEMSVPLDIRAGLIVKNYLENNSDGDENESVNWLKKRERIIGKQLMIVRMSQQANERGARKAELDNIIELSQKEAEMIIKGLLEDAVGDHKIVIRKGG